MPIGMSGQVYVRQHFPVLPHAYAAAVLARPFRILNILKAQAPQWILHLHWLHRQIENFMHGVHAVLERTGSTSTAYGLIVDEVALVFPVAEAHSVNAMPGAPGFLRKSFH